jgi:hypothetical protein
MSQATGQVVMAPGAATALTTNKVASGVGNVVSVGSSLLAGKMALNQGATASQALGVIVEED